MVFIVSQRTKREKFVDQQTAQALQDFTQRYIDIWQQQQQSLQCSTDLYGIPSPCITTTLEDAVCWQSVPVTDAVTLEGVARALDITLQPAIHTYYTTQYAGDMRARFLGETLTLLQVWSPDDFLRVQENLIGHLVTQKRLKLSPTLFIATLDSELDVISVCNLTGEVVKETLGTQHRQSLSPSLASFLNQLEPIL